MNIERLVASLDKRIDFHRSNPNDQLQIGNSVIACLCEMRGAIQEAQDAEVKPPPPPVYSPRVIEAAEKITQELISKFETNATGITKLVMSNPGVLEERLKVHLSAFEKALLANL